MQVDAIIRELADKQAIYELLAHYAERVDANDPVGAADCYAEDGSGVYWQECIGREAIADRLGALLDGCVATSHHLSNVQIKVSGDTAQAQSYVYSFMRMAETLEATHYWGRWIDQLVRVDGIWLFQHREVVGVGSISSGENDLKHPGHPGRLSRPASAKADFWVRD